jgi:hypothetical protein
MVVVVVIVVVVVPYLELQAIKIYYSAGVAPMAAICALADHTNARAKLRLIFCA